MSKAFIICGSPAAGKTSYGRKLAKMENACLLDIDISTEPLVQKALSESGHDKDDRDSEYFKQTYREVIYQTMFDTARENLKWIDVVIVGPFTRELRMESWPETLSSELGSEVEIHYVFCNTDERRQRIIKRNSERDNAKLTNWEKLNTYYGDEQPPPFEHVFVDTSSK